MPTPFAGHGALPVLSLATGAAHDLRNVLLVIRGQCERLLADVDPSDPRTEEMQAIRDSAERGIALAGQMVADGSAERPRTVDAGDVIRNMLPLLTRLAGGRVRLEVGLGRGTWPVAANVVQIEQIVMNLVTNARDAMPDGGTVMMAIESRTSGSPPDLPDCVVISVTDTGTGIDPAVQDRIFEPYFTTKAASGGSGVGLATIRQIVATHGGHVEVSSTPGEGTTFRIALPRGPEPEPAAAAVSVRTAAGERAARVLLVENEPAIRDYLRRCLIGAGFEVDDAACGADAVRAGETHAAVDVLVTDVHLPDIEGPEVARRLTARRPGVRVVFMSGELEAVERLSSGGAVPVLAKPFTVSDLVNAVRTALLSRQAA